MESFGFGQDHASLKLFDVDTCEIHSRPLACPGFLDSLSMNLSSTYSDAYTFRQQIECGAFSNFSRDECAGNNSTKTFHRECAIDR